jgi:hypothetical protein
MDLLESRETNINGMREKENRCESRERYLNRKQVGLSTPVSYHDVMLPSRLLLFIDIISIKA